MRAVVRQSAVQTIAVNAVVHQNAARTNAMNAAVHRSVALRNVAIRAAVEPSPVSVNTTEPVVACEQMLRRNRRHYCIR